MTDVTDADREKTIDRVKVADCDELPVLVGETVVQAESLDNRVKVGAGLLIDGEMEERIDTEAAEELVGDFVTALTLTVLDAQ